jgi:hypothetical protein
LRPANAIMKRMREGTGITFGKMIQCMILANISTLPGIRIEICNRSSSTDSPSTLPASTVSLNTYLFFSTKNIIESPTAGFSIVSPCTGTAAPSICSNACFFTCNAPCDKYGGPGFECDLHRVLFNFDAFFVAPMLATRASPDQVERERNVFAEPVAANNSASPRPELEAMNPYVSPEPILVATETESPYLPNNPTVMRCHQSHFSLAHTEKCSYRSIELDNGTKVLLGSNPSATIMVASVDVSTGSYSDPQEYPVIAHLYEHVLSPSNATLPKKDEHETFLASACFNASEGNSSDDGGACTQYYLTECTLGTDCTDCGPRPNASVIVGTELTCNFDKGPLSLLSSSGPPTCLLLAVRCSMRPRRWQATSWRIS